MQQHDPMQEATEPWISTALAWDIQAVSYATSP
jgi:hypothetical protein